MKPLFLVLLLLTLITGYFLGFNIYFKNKIYPNVKVEGINLGGKTPQEAEYILRKNIKTPESIKIIAKEKDFIMSLKEIVTYDHKKTAFSAFKVYRSNSYLNNLTNILVSPFIVQNINLSYFLDKNKIGEYLQVVSEQVAVQPVFPSVYIQDGNIIVDKGKAGETLDTVSFVKKIENQTSTGKFSEIRMSYIQNNPSISDIDAEDLKIRAEKLIGKSLSLKKEFDAINLTDSDILNFLKARGGYEQDKILEIIDTKIKPEVEREPQDAVFRYENYKVIEFIPSKDGLIIDKEQLKNLIIDNITKLEQTDEKNFSLDIPLERKSPKVTIEEINNLGIKELLGRGSSKFKGSISNRIHNISLASSKFNGVLIAPNEIFSFNKILGDVSVFTGYKQAYIIKDGKTVLGDGGGVCQVSTTLFRAILNAGLPITERRSHSYRVGYYEQDSPPGFDATVFDPSTDLKFMNDTPGYLLIQTDFNSKNNSLVFEVYGTSDNRTVNITKPVIYDVSAPPEDLYVDDPTIPLGTVKQIEYKAWGSKVTFEYTIIRDNKVIFEKKFMSNYHPWQAVFLRGTKTSN